MRNRYGQMDQDLYVRDLNDALNTAIILIEKFLLNIDYIQGAYDRGYKADGTVKEAEKFLEHMNE